MDAGAGSRSRGPAENRRIRSVRACPAPGLAAGSGGRAPALRAFGRAASRGQALVELSFIMAFVGGFFLLTFDYARAMNVYLVVVHATREAARVAALDNTTSTQVENAAKNAAADFVSASALTVTCSQINFNPANPTASTVVGACASPRTADTAFRVTVTTTFQPLVPVVGFAAGGGYSGTISISHSLVGMVLQEP